MPYHNLEDVTLLDEMNTWEPSKYTTIIKATGIHALDREKSRENIARAFMLTCGYSLDDIFYGSETLQHNFGKSFAALLETASGYTDDPIKETPAAQLTQIFFKENPDAKKRINEADYPNTKIRNQQILEEIYYTAVKKISEITYPDINYSTLDELRPYADRLHAVSNIGIHLSQGFDRDHGQALYARIREKHDDLDIYTNRISLNNDLQKAIAAACTDIGDPIEYPKLLEALGGRMVLNLYGNKLAGASIEELQKMYTFEEISYTKCAANEILPDLDPLQYPQVRDFIEGKPKSVAPYYINEEIIENGNRKIIVRNPVKAAAYDLRIPKFNFTNKNLSLPKALLFDQVLDHYKENPAVCAEPAVKRIYIDGKNAYDMFKTKYQGSEMEIQEHVKEEIVKTLMNARHHVEIARMDRSHDGKPVACVRPIKADFTVLDQRKRWYQSSFVKKADKLWKNDPGRRTRASAIIKAAEVRQTANLLSNTYYSAFYSNIRNEISTIRMESTDDPMKQRSCNIKIMETMTQKMRDNISSENNPEGFKNDIRSIRSLMETVGVSQEDMHKFGTSLSGEQKQAFHQIRSWEKTVLNRAPGTRIPSAAENLDVKACVDRMLKMYQSAYYNKLGYEKHSKSR